MADLLKLSRPTINSIWHCKLGNQAIYRWSIYFQGVPCLYERDFCWSKSMAYVSDKMMSMVNGKCCMPHAPHSKPFQFSLPPRRKKHRPKRSRSFPVPYLERLSRCYCVDRVMRWLLLLPTNLLENCIFGVKPRDFVILLSHICSCLHSKGLLVSSQRVKCPKIIQFPHDASSCAAWAQWCTTCPQSIHTQIHMRHLENHTVNFPVLAGWFSNKIV